MLMWLKSFHLLLFVSVFRNREDRVLDGPASGEKGSKGRNELDCIRGPQRSGAQIPRNTSILRSFLVQKKKMCLSWFKTTLRNRDIGPVQVRTIMFSSAPIKLLLALIRSCS